MGILMSLNDEIRDLIGDLYDGEISARQFRQKFAPMYAKSDTYFSEIQNLFFDIDATYAEYMMGRFDEQELRKRLFDVLPSARVQVHVPEVANSAEVWGMPVAATRNHSPRLPSRQSTKQSIEIHIER